MKDDTVESAEISNGRCACKVDWNDPKRDPELVGRCIVVGGRMMKEEYFDGWSSNGCEEAKEEICSGSVESHMDGDSGDRHNGRIGEVGNAESVEIAAEVVLEAESGDGEKNCRWRWRSRTVRKWNIEEEDAVTDDDPCKGEEQRRPPRRDDVSEDRDVNIEEGKVVAESMELGVVIVEEGTENCTRSGIRCP